MSASQSAGYYDEYGESIPLRPRGAIVHVSTGLANRCAATGVI